MQNSNKINFEKNDFKEALFKYMNIEIDKGCIIRRKALSALYVSLKSRFKYRFLNLS